MHQISGHSISAWAKLWTDPTTGIVSQHPLIAHCADVAAVTEALLFLPTIRNRMACAGGLPDLDEVQVARLAVFAFLHDLGKCNRGFQNKEHRGADLPTAGHTSEALVLLGRDPRLTQQFIYRVGWTEIASWGGDESMLRLLIASLSHHGDPLVLDNARTGDARWWDAKALDDLSLLGQQARVWWPIAWTVGGTPLPDIPRFQHMFAGLVALADWLGSDMDFFHFDLGDGSDRMIWSRQAAVNAVRVVGLAAGRVPEDAPNEFTSAFGFAPRPIQEAIQDAPLEQIVVLEGETGSGKTEAALWYWRRLHDAGLVDGLYFALPTRSAGVQIHDRVSNALRCLWGPEAPACVLAVPGYIRADDYKGQRLPGWEVLWDDQAQGAERHRRWAAEAPRRFLAAYVAVGTIDQALLGALRVTHSAQRASALARALLVVDEVHASDAYMGSILVRLVQHHIACGGYVLALSATLGASLRAALMDHPVPDLRTALEVPYPVVHAGNTVISAPATTSRTLKLITVPVDRVLHLVREALRDDAAVLTVRNTVRDAIQTTKALEAAGIRVLLHHGRYAPEDRRELDRAVERALGKKRRTGAACIVGTQTLEQSLDIDADVLITDACPMDVLLQRVGRLHRHSRVGRPPRWANPQAVVLVPPAGIQALLIGGHASQGLGLVYRDLRIIQLTLEEIERRGQVSVPDECRELIERTTHPEMLAAIGCRSPAWDAWGRKVDGEAISASGVAAMACVDRTIAWGERGIISAREVGDKAATRLGARDVRVEVNWPGAVAPVVRSLSLPGRLLPGVDPMSIRVGSTEILAGRWRFTYGRYGLEWTRA